jgi:hypothetical protein
MAWRRIPLSLVLASLVLAGCSKKPVVEEQVMCTMEARPALAVVVLDSATGTGLAQVAMAVAREGVFADTLRGTDSIVSGAHERAGTYRVELSAPGYADWSRDGIKVDRDACHVQTAQLRALLVRR